MTLMRYIIPCLASGSIAFIVYFLTLCPTIATGDSVEFVTAAATWGVPHAPGYPLYTLIGHIFTKLPWNDIPWRVNLASAVFEAGAVGVLAGFILRLTGNKLAAFSGALFLAFAEGFWFNGLVAEVFALNNFLAACILFLAIRSKTIRHFWFLSCLFGMAVGHHHTVILFFPALAIYFWKTQPELLKPPLLTKALVWCFLGYIAFNVITLIRASQHPPINWGQASTIQNWIRLLARQDYGGLVSPYLRDRPELEPVRLEHLVYMAKSYLRQFTWPGLCLAAFGLFALRSNRIMLSVSLTGFMVSGPLFVLYANSPLSSLYTRAAVERFYLLPMLWISLWIGYGIKFLSDRLGNRLSLRIIIMFLWLAPLASNRAVVDQSSNKLAQIYAEDLITGTEPEALLLVIGDAPTFILDYLSAVEKRAGNRKIINVAMLRWPWYRTEIQQRYPDVIVPDAKPGHTATLAIDIAQANWGRFPIYASPQMLRSDPKFAESYFFKPTKLFLKAEVNPEFDIVSFASDTDIFLKGTWVNEFNNRWSKRPSLEIALLQQYLYYMLNVGTIYAMNGFDGDAEIVFNQAQELADKTGITSLSEEIRQLIAEAKFRVKAPA